jgi:alpha-D-ribose 1-methylphosphonate 5-triphosphate synthase subunit PhnG
MALDDSRHLQKETTARQHWMSLLASAKPARLETLFPRDGFPRFVYLRKPETGLVMLRGRVGGIGSPFNMGEATVTRCSIRLENGAVGHAFVMGRSHPQAVTAAICDALLQGPDNGDVARDVLAPLAEERAERERDFARQNAATKVDFFTVARGEDD